MKIGNRLDVLAIDIGDQTRHILLQMCALCGLLQACRKWLNKLLQPLQDTLHGLGLHLGLRHQFLITHRKTPRAGR
jgi:hypothetical protein